MDANADGVTTLEEFLTWLRVMQQQKGEKSTEKGKNWVKSMLYTLSKRADEDAAKAAAEAQKMIERREAQRRVKATNQVTQQGLPRAVLSYGSFSVKERQFIAMGPQAWYTTGVEQVTIRQAADYGSSVHCRVPIDTSLRIDVVADLGAMQGRPSLSCRVVEPEKYRGWTQTEVLICDSGQCGRCMECGEGLLPSERFAQDMEQELEDSPFLREALSQLHDCEIQRQELQARCRRLEFELSREKMARSALEPPQDKEKARCYGQKVIGDCGQTLIGAATVSEYLPTRASQRARHKNSSPT